MLDLGFLMRGEIIWDKAASASPSTAWGSWMSAANPTLRDVHEYILVFSKDTFSRPKVDGREPTMASEEFLELTRSVWSFPAESARRVGHPAPFPVELPHRCIQAVHLRRTKWCSTRSWAAVRTAVAATFALAGRSWATRPTPTTARRLAKLRVNEVLVLTGCLSPQLDLEVSLTT